MYVDTHLHLHEPWLSDKERITEANRQKAIADITQCKIVTWAQSCDIPSYEKTLEYSKQSEYIFPSISILMGIPWKYPEGGEDILRVLGIFQSLLI